MPKRVQIRRGTTAQHATFTGALGEVTYDTDLRCLRLHDGVTAGGVRLDPDDFVLLTPSSPLVEQTIASGVTISGGLGYGLTVEKLVRVKDTLYAVKNFQCDGVVNLTPAAVAYSASVAVDFSLGTTARIITLGGNLTLTSTGFYPGALVRVKVIGDGSLRTLTFPAAWRWVGSTAPANIAANKIGSLELRSWGTTEAEVTARWLVES